MSTGDTAFQPHRTVTEAVYPHCGYLPGHQDTATTVLPTTPPVCVQRHKEERRYCRTLSHWWIRRRKL